MKKRNIPFVILIIVAFILILIACGRSQAQGLSESQSVGSVEQSTDGLLAADIKRGEAQHEVESEGEHKDDGHTHSPGEHMAGAHDVPEEAAAVSNPVPATEESIATGAAIYAQNCAVCHGESGQGDGPAAATLEMKPANLHAGHVQGLSDGALFYIISHGRPETPMPAWDNVLTEDQRWQVVNFLRTFDDGEKTEQAGEVDGHGHADDVEADHHEDEGVEGQAEHEGEGHADGEGHLHSEGESH